MAVTTGTRPRLRQRRPPPPPPRRRPARARTRAGPPAPRPRCRSAARHDHALADPQGHHPRRSTPAAAAFRQRNLARGSGLGPRSRKARQASVADGIDRAHLQMADRRSRHRRFLVLRPAVGAGQTLLRGPCRRRLPTDERAPRPPPLIILLQEGGGPPPVAGPGPPPPPTGGAPPPPPPVDLSPKGGARSPPGAPFSLTKCDHRA